MADYNSVEVLQGNGDLIQSGIVSITGNWITVTFPQAFSNTPIVVATGVFAGGAATAPFFVEIATITATTFLIQGINWDGLPHRSPTDSMTWVAIGQKSS